MKFDLSKFLAKTSLLRNMKKHAHTFALKFHTAAEM
jgi:hypothetical protein